MSKGILVFIIAFLSVLLLAAHEYLRFFDSKLHVIFCDVGQGDAILLQTPNNRQILIDAGPDEKILSCLSSHMPFWDRTIELVLLTHPHSDHFFGLKYVLERYTIMSFASEDLDNNTAGFNLVKAMLEKQVKTKYLTANDTFRTKDKVTLSILSPTREFLMKTSPGGQIGESKEFASLITLISYGSFSALLTGDSQNQQVQDVMSKLNSVDVLQVPHHGSKTGLDMKTILAVQPKLAVISVGKNNYGHPAKQILKMLSDASVRVLRTDRNRDVVVTTDGSGWMVE